MSDDKRYEEYSRKQLRKWSKIDESKKEKSKSKAKKRRSSDKEHRK